MSSQEAYFLYAGELEKLASLVDTGDEEIQERFAQDVIGGAVATRSYDATMSKLAKADAGEGIWNAIKTKFRGVRDSDVVQGAKKNPYITGGALGGAAGLGTLGGYAAFGRRKEAGSKVDDVADDVVMSLTKSDKDEVIKGLKELGVSFAGKNSTRNWAIGAGAGGAAAAGAGGYAMHRYKNRKR